MIEIFNMLMGGGIVTLITFLIQRHDSKHDKLDNVLEEISKIAKEVKRIDEKSDQRAAISARVRILRFADEMREERRHSKDAWDQALQDCDEYEHYGNTHPDFPNNITTATIDFIKRNYMERLERNDFL